MINDRSIKHLISWTEKGDTFRVHNANLLAQEVLPKYYKHRNFTSLVRQLNMYGFHKVVGVDQGGLKGNSDQVWEFIHPYVHRDHPELLPHVRRKDASMSAAKSKSGKTDVNSIVSELHTIRFEHSMIADKFLDMERQNHALEQEVRILKNQNTEQQWKIHKILQFIAQIFERGEELPASKRGRYIEGNTERANAVELPPELSELDLPEPLGSDARPSESFVDLPAAARLLVDDHLLSMPAVSAASMPDPAGSLSAAADSAAPAAAAAAAAKLSRLHSVDENSSAFMGNELQGLGKRLDSTRPRLANAGLDQATLASLYHASHLDDSLLMNSSLHSFLGDEFAGVPDISLPANFASGMPVAAAATATAIPTPTPGAPLTARSKRSLPT